MRLPPILAALAIIPSAAPAQRAEGDFIAKDFRFVSGETLPELKLHYVTLGTPRRVSASSITSSW